MMLNRYIVFCITVCVQITHIININELIYLDMNLPIRAVRVHVFLKNPFSQLV